jgi:large subunit ribosomal protein L27e
MAATGLVTPGRFVVLTGGRHAGKKAIVLQAYPDPTDSRKYPHAVVLGIDKAPKPLKKEMSDQELVKKTQIKCFVKTINFNHLLLTRHVMKDDDFWAKANVADVITSMADPAQKKACLDNLASMLRQKYLNNRVPWFFKTLKF